MIKHNPAKNHDIISPEKIVIHQWYSYTLNPPPLDDKWYNEIQTHAPLIRDSLNGLSYGLFPEISKTGRIHYHGAIWFPTKASIFLFYRKLPDWQLSLDTIEDLDKWKNYCMKLRKPMKKIMASMAYPYPITEENIDMINPLDIIITPVKQSKQRTRSARTSVPNAEQRL